MRNLLRFLERYVQDLALDAEVLPSSFLEGEKEALRRVLRYIYDGCEIEGESDTGATSEATPRAGRAVRPVWLTSGISTSYTRPLSHNGEDSEGSAQAVQLSRGSDTELDPEIWDASLPRRVLGVTDSVLAGGLQPEQYTPPPRDGFIEVNQGVQAADASSPTRINESEIQINDTGAPR